MTRWTVGVQNYLSWKSWHYLWRRRQFRNYDQRSGNQAFPPLILLLIHDPPWIGHPMSAVACHRTEAVSQRKHRGYFHAIHCSHFLICSDLDNYCRRYSFFLSRKWSVVTKRLVYAGRRRNLRSQEAGGNAQDGSCCLMLCACRAQAKSLHVHKD